MVKMESLGYRPLVACDHASVVGYRDLRCVCGESVCLGTVTLPQLGEWRRQHAKCKA